ncbi:MAG TPA: MgtC/SapB family protein [Patescibacteria group bacterium]|nr:MgtC/SapB family protein [Patescibacteria group bacterium]
MDWFSQIKIIGEVALAMFLGGLIGVEREIANKPAGFRTHMLVAGAAAMLVALGEVVAIDFLKNVPNEAVRSDPMRIIGAIVTGVSFLGAGTIFRNQKGEHVEGLTTAATILLSAAIGTAVSVKQIVLAIGVTVLSLAVLRGARIMETWIGQKKEREKSRQTF